MLTDSIKERRRRLFTAERRRWPCSCMRAAAKGATAWPVALLVIVTACSDDPTSPDATDFATPAGSSEALSDVAPGIVWNSTTDFSITANPNGAWSYGWFTEDPDNLRLFRRTILHFGLHAWVHDFALWPAVYLNPASTPAFGIPAGGIALHPGCGNEVTALRWSAPVAGDYNVRATFLLGEQGRAEVRIEQPHPSNTTGNRTLWSALSDDQDLTWEGTLNFVAAGEFVDFQVSKFDGCDFDTTPLEVVITPANSAPVVTAIALPADPVRLGDPATVTATFIDADPADVHSSILEWGDGASSSGITGEGTVSGSHEYAQTGVYRVTVSVDDGIDSGYRSSEADMPSYVVVYDPAGGFVTGGGWITSPAGAYAANLELSGKASFGFVSKYNRGATVPVGNTEFQFQAAGFKFKSTSYDWLVVSGARAQYKGSGYVNGGGDYGFMLTAVDGQLDGGGGLDRLRLRVWDKATSAIIYDNEATTADSSDPTTALGGGSIVIHKAK